MYRGGIFRAVRRGGTRARGGRRERGVGVGDDARAESAEREAERFAHGSARGSSTPGTTKVLHLRANPESLANESAAERELAVVRGECEALRETVAQFHAAQAAAAAANTAGAGAGAGGGAAVGVPWGDAGEGRDAAGVRGGDARYVSVHARSRDRFRGDARRAGVRGDAGPVGGGGGAHGGGRRVADLEKREQRYMAMFKKQIWNFREAVYLIFGYKVDMGEDKATGMPTATLRSKFAAREDELITIRVEPAKVGATGAAGGGKVDLLPTPYAETPEVKLMVDTFVGRCRSVPRVRGEPHHGTLQQADARVRERG